jgi:hydrogenase maturation protein HypF
VSSLSGPLALPEAPSRPLLACGAGDPLAVCLAFAGAAWLADAGPELPGEAVERMSGAAQALEREHGVAPELVVHDRDPQQPAAAYARARRRVRRLAVDHHHAHAASLLAEHAERGPAIVVVLDGGGLGPDETVWGGEVLLAELGCYERVGLLLPVRLPGGRAEPEPAWKVGCSWLTAALGTDFPPATPAMRVGEEEWRATCERIRSGLDAPLTTSAGRLLEAVGSMLGAGAGPAGAPLPAAPLDSVRDSSHYEVDLIADASAPAIVDPRPAVRAALEDAEAGVAADTIGTRLRMGLARGFATAAARAAAQRGIELVGMTGDTLEDPILRACLGAELGRLDIRPLTPSRVPGHDGGLPLGQAAVAIAGGA